MEWLDQMNRCLHDKIYVAPDPHDDRDARKIAMLETRVARMEEAIHTRKKLIDEKNIKLKEEVMMETSDTALASKDDVINQLHHCLHRNYYNIVHLGSHCYRDRGMVERLQAAWKRSDRRRIELEEMSMWIPVEFRKRLREETFALPVSRLHMEELYPQARVATNEMTRALSTLTQLYSGDPLELSTYFDNESLSLWRGPTPEYHPGDGDMDDKDFPLSD